MSTSSGHRILLIAGHYCPLIGGAQAVYDALARELPDTIHVLTSKRDYVTGEYVDGAEAFDRDAPYKITRIDRMRTDMLGPSPGLITRLATKVKGALIDRAVFARIRQICDLRDIHTVVFGASGAMNWLPIKLSKAKFMQGRKLVYYAHGEEISQTAYSERSEQQRKKALAAADVVVSVSSFTTALLTEKYNVQASAILTLQNGVNFEKYSAPTGINVDEKYDTRNSRVVIGAGRMVARKGFLELVKAWQGVLEKEPDAKLMLAGTGPEVDTIRDAIAAMKLENSVSQLGFVDDRDLIALYQRADVFCMPNRTMPDGDTEGFGLVFLEAAAAGTPGVGGRAGGVIDAIVDGETGFLVDGGNHKDIAAAIVGMLSSSELLENMSLRARQHAQHNQWSAKASELLSFLETLR